MTVVQSLRRWIYRNARPLDLARWQFHFENGTKENVLTALSAYQNADGGFAHALEPDAWTPHSSPIQTWAAVELLREIGVREHSVIQGILRYLESGDSFAAGKWATGIKSNNEYPHAFWWSWKPDTLYDYNPTANLAGFILKHAPAESRLHTKAAIIAEQAAASFLKRTEINDPHLLLCFVRLYQACAESNIHNLFNMKDYSEKIVEHVSNYLKNMDFAWLCDGVAFECIKACDAMLEYFPEKHSIGKVTAYLLDSLESDSFFHIPWDWKGYEKEWAITKNWWKAYGIIGKMLFLKQYSDIFNQKK